MTDLANFPPEVREAIEQFDCVTMHGDKWKVIRAELLRLNTALAEQCTAADEVIAWAVVNGATNEIYDIFLSEDAADAVIEYECNPDYCKRQVAYAHPSSLTSGQGKERVEPVSVSGEKQKFDEDLLWAAECEFQNWYSGDNFRQAIRASFEYLAAHIGDMR